MKLEEQVVSLELAKQLKELGIKQESLFYWVTTTYNEEPYLVSPESLDVLNTTVVPMSVYQDDGAEGYSWDVREAYAAFTATELGELLPLYLKADADRGISFSVETHGLNIRKTFDNKKWMIDYGARYETDEKEANARAKMLIHIHHELA